MLSGCSSLQHTYVERAQVGIEVVGDDNTLQDVNINSSETGLVFRGQTERRRIARGHGAGVIIASSSLHDDSRIAGNNIHDNGDGPVQLQTLHNEGTLDISGNYWAQISDPELSASCSTRCSPTPGPARCSSPASPPSRSPRGPTARCSPKRSRSSATPRGCRAVAEGTSRAPAPGS
ncbi:MAG: hypothetical protein AAGF11_00065 [Myxococcota bacterium]